MADKSNNGWASVAEVAARDGAILSEGFRNIGRMIATHPDTPKLARALVEWRRDSERMLADLFAQKPGWRR